MTMWDAAAIGAVIGWALSSYSDFKARLVQVEAEIATLRSDMDDSACGRK